MDVVSPGRSRSGFILAVLAVLAMIGIRAGLSPILKESAPLILFLFPVVLSAWFGGFGPGILATVLGFLAGMVLFTNPANSTQVHSVFFQWAARGVPFGMVGAFISIFADTIERARAAAAASGEESRRSEEFVRRLMASSSDSFQVLDLSGRVLPNQTRGVTAAPPFPAGDWAEWSAGWDAAYRPAAEAAIATARSGRAATFTAGAGDKWWDVALTPVLDRDAYPERLLAVSRDITERKRAEVALRESADHHRSFVELNPQIPWTADPQGNILDFSDRWLELSGLTREQSVGSGWVNATHPGDVPRTMEAWSHALTTGEPYDVEHRVRLADGSYRWSRARAFPRRDADGRIVRWYGTTEDIDAAKRTQESLRQSEAQFRQIADTMPQIVWGANAAGKIDYFNRRWYDYTGLPPVPTTAGVERHEVLPADDLAKVRAAWAACVAAGTPYELEFRICRASDRTLRWHLGRAVPLSDGSGNVIRWLGTNTDIHDYKILQEQNAALLQSERAARNDAERQSRMREEFLATLSHELRTPLNAILGWVQVIQAGASEGEELAEGLQIIERNARSQARMIEDLLDMSRIISGKVRLDMQPVDAATVVTASLQTVQPTAALKNLRLVTMIDPRAGNVAGDPNRLQQVAWNLLTNAVKFTPAGGSVTVALVREGEIVRLTVTDTGDGIAPDFLPQVFDRFRQADASTTRRHNGLGLGLSIVKQLVELHGGTITAASDGPGRGATFTVTLPVASATAATPSESTELKTSERNTRLAGRRVLVVDDEPDARAFVRRLLEDHRAEVHTASSAEEALTELSTWPADVLVSDIGMPGQDGYDLIRRLRQRGPGDGSATPAIALTAYARVEDRVRVVVAGFQAHLAKPVNVAELLATIASLADGAGEKM